MAPSLYQAHGNKSTKENLCLKNFILEINTNKRVVKFIYVMKFKFALEPHVGREAKKHAHTYPHVHNPVGRENIPPTHW